MQAGKKIIAVILSAMLIITLIPDIGFANENKPVTESNVAEKDAIEKTEESTTYKLDNGANMTVIYGEPVRFKDENGNLVDYDPALQKIENETSKNGKALADYAYENKKNDSKQYKQQDG